MGAAEKQDKDNRNVVYQTDTQELWFGSPDKRDIVIPEFKKQYSIWKTIVTCQEWIQSEAKIHPEMDLLTQHIILEKWEKHKPNPLIQQDIENMVKRQNEKRRWKINLPYEGHLLSNYDLPGEECEECIVLKTRDSSKMNVDISEYQENEDLQDSEY